MKEIWKDIPDTNGNYQVSNQGNVCNGDKYRHTAGGYIWRYADDRDS